MGGVLAVVNFDGMPVDPAVLKKMAEQCVYRGPDGIRYWIRGNVGLAHLALHATQESLREEMPMLSADGSLVLTADARVDNRPELIEALRARGQPTPPDPTDADLILAAYQCWGEDCPAQIIGDYAFIIWDEAKQHLFCARDVYGVKSLHYTRAGMLLCVASEAQMIIQHPAVPRFLDEDALLDYLAVKPDLEGRSMFRDVRAVKRAHCLTATAADQRMTRYWDIDPEYRIRLGSDAEYAARFLEIFTRCVSDRLRAPEGANAGITMSGGLDSTSVAAVAHKLLKDSPESPHLTACTYAFESLKDCDETGYSQAMADELGLDLNLIPAEKFWYLDNDQAFTPSLETPFMAGESLTHHILDLFQTRGARFWLTGHGGDNLVTGNPYLYADRLARGDVGAIFEVARLCRQYQVPLFEQLRILEEWMLRPLVPDFVRVFVRRFRKAAAPDWMTAGSANRLRSRERGFGEAAPVHFAERARQLAYESAVQSDALRMALAWSERLGASHHLEARHPFLDRRLAEFVLAIPSEQLFHPEWTKLILRRAMQGLLPEIIRNRLGKTEFSSYIGLSLRKREIGKIKVILSDTCLNAINMVKINQILVIYDRYLSDGKTPDAINTWLFICIKLWFANYSFIFQGDHHYEFNKS